MPGYLEAPPRLVEVTRPHGQVFSELEERWAEQSKAMLGDRSTVGSLSPAGCANSVSPLALNPSSAEFLSNKGEWLVKPRRRLASLLSLGASDPRDLDDDAVALVLGESNAYFAGPNWYRRWFGRLESLLGAAGLGSYLDGTACHLDLVQWCTEPIQRKVPPAAWKRLVETDREFLGWQLRQKTLDVVLVNGMSCVQELQTAGVIHSWTEDRVAYVTKAGPAELRVFQTEELGVRFLGWNRPVAGQLPADGHEKLQGWLVASTGAATSQG